MITGVAGTELTDQEAAFIKNENPWGLILFARNIAEPAQVKNLTSAFKEITGRENAPVLIDQEGGRVQRLRPPHWQTYATGQLLGDIWRSDKQAGERAIYLQSRLMAHDLNALGINVDCLPVLDVPVEGGHDVIGDRAYSRNADEVATMGGIASKGLMAGGVLPVIKHIPGHGRAGADSHKELPKVEARLNELEASDFVPFQKLAHLPMAMTAHVLYQALDTENCATVSSHIISNIIRDYIGFDGLLMSDDLSMQALKGDFTERAQACFDAGCDVVLHCNGVMDEMTKIVSVCRDIEGAALQRAENALSQLSTPDEIDVDALRAQFNAAIEPAS